MNNTGIEYLNLSWNPIAMRCMPCSEGCQNCWHLRMCDRLAANPTIPTDVRAAYAGDAPPVLVPERLDEPLRRRKAARIGVMFMGDLFHEAVTDGDRFHVWEEMRKASWHTFIVLTKRAQAAYEWVDYHTSTWLEHQPLPNIWGLVTVENQERADERLPWLLKTPFAVRGVSYEPALGPVNLERYVMDCDGCGNQGSVAYETSLCQRACIKQGERPSLNWLVAGGETGPGARPAHPDWFRSMQRQCAAAGVPFFFKGFGGWESIGYQLERDVYPPNWHRFPDGTTMIRAERGKPDRLLYGRMHEEWPQ